MKGCSWSAGCCMGFPVIELCPCGRSGPELTGAAVCQSAQASQHHVIWQSCLPSGVNGLPVVQPALVEKGLTFKAYLAVYAVTPCKFVVRLFLQANYRLYHLDIFNHAFCLHTTVSVSVSGQTNSMVTCSP